MKAILPIILAIAVIFAAIQITSASSSGNGTGTNSYNGISVGDVITGGELTHYCACSICCGKSDGITASGIKIQNGVKPEIDIASCNWLPLGAMIEVNGIGYLVADRGGSSLDQVGKLDIFVPEGHTAALNLGIIKGVSIKIISLP